jgi:hypothetical protein
MSAFYPPTILSEPNPELTARVKKVTAFYLDPKGLYNVDVLYYNGVPMSYCPDCGTGVRFDGSTKPEAYGDCTGKCYHKKTVSGYFVAKFNHHFRRCGQCRSLFFAVPDTQFCSKQCFDAVTYDD